MPPARRVRVVEDDAPDQDPIAAALSDLAAAIREGTEAFKPAAETIHGMGARLDALCKWLMSMKTWGIICLMWLLAKYAPDLAEQLGPSLTGSLPL